MLEIEVKLKIDSFKAVAEKLTQLGAKFDGDFVQTDTYYDDSEDSLINSDRCLRIREHQNHIGKSIEITYKGARENGRFKSRREIGVKVEKAAEAAEIFKNIGYTEKLTIEKKRQLWDIENCKVALDELPLIGKFIEIEGPSEQIIEEIQKKIGLENISHTPKSYAHLIEEAIRKNGKSCKTVKFDTKL